MSRVLWNVQGTAIASILALLGLPTITAPLEGTCSAPIQNDAG
jgi:hypothetical protein